ncbi:conserved hypothetical protein [Ricinus communis]|uniref:RNase H type-1 domain-containing protein n=1 Tax=Ricinus communis TaxID=3988 RepID=B9RCU3_RICCO|nr:conserved hypothetical protein [Ricinus communis]
MGGWIFHEHWNVSITNAELWGLYQGLLLAWELDIKQLVVEIDNASVVTMVNDMELVNGPNGSLVENIKRLLKRG